MAARVGRIVEPVDGAQYAKLVDWRYCATEGHLLTVTSGWFRRCYIRCFRCEMRVGPFSAEGARERCRHLEVAQARDLDLPATRYPPPETARRE